MNNWSHICWFSCGAASAVAAHIAVEIIGDVRVVYCDTSADEHEDNARFKADVEQWIGQPIEVIRHPSLRTVEEVFAKQQYMSGPKGAPCTVVLKKKPRFAYQRPDDIHVFGLTSDEDKRIKRFEAANLELKLWWPLRDMKVTKQDALDIVKAARIKLPVMYGLGFNNNNCKGCVKATSPHYWNKVREHFPDVFTRRAEQSRKLGCRLTRVKGKRIFLDELEPDNTEVIDEDLSCGPQCGLPDSTSATTDEE